MFHINKVQGHNSFEEIGRGLKEPVDLAVLFVCPSICFLTLPSSDNLVIIYVHFIYSHLYVIYETRYVALRKFKFRMTIVRTCVLSLIIFEISENYEK